MYHPTQYTLWNSLPDSVFNLDSPKAFRKSATDVLNEL